ALPVHIAMKSASLSSSVQSALSPAPWMTALRLRSIVHWLSGALSLKRKILPTLPATSGFLERNAEMPPKMSALIGSTEAEAAPAWGAAAAGFAFGFGISG